MQLVELMMVVCLIAQPERCRDEAMHYIADNNTPMQLMMAAPAEIAKWNEAHPNYFVKRWTTRPAGRFAKV